MFHYLERINKIDQFKMNMLDVVRLIRACWDTSIFSYCLLRVCSRLTFGSAVLASKQYGADVIVHPLACAVTWYNSLFTTTGTEGLYGAEITVSIMASFFTSPALNAFTWGNSSWPYSIGNRSWLACKRTVISRLRCRYSWLLVHQVHLCSGWRCHWSGCRLWLPWCELRRPCWRHRVCVGRFLSWCDRLLLFISNISDSRFLTVRTNSATSVKSLQRIRRRYSGSMLHYSHIKHWGLEIWPW